MGRSKQSLKLITNERTRNSTFLKRKNGLKKKIDEFSVLCDIDVCMFIYGPSSADRPPDVYPPNLDKLHRIIERYQSMDKDDRERRRLTVADFYDEHTKKIEDEVTKLREKNDQDLQKLVWDDRFNNLTVDQLHQIIKKLDFKINYMDIQKEMIMKGNNNNNDNGYYYSSSVVPNQNLGDMKQPCYGQQYDHTNSNYYHHNQQYHQQMLPMHNPSSYDHPFMMMYDNTSSIVPMNLMSSINCCDGRNFIDNNSGDFSYPTITNQLPYAQMDRSMGNHMEFGSSSISSSYDLQQPSMVTPINANFPNMMMDGGSSTPPPTLMSSINGCDSRNFIDNNNNGDFLYPTAQNQLLYDQTVRSMVNHMEFGNSTISSSYNLQQPSMVPPINSNFPNTMVDGGQLSPELSTNEMVQNQSTV